MTDQHILARPEVGPSSPWTFPQHHVHTLTNGLTVWWIPIPGQYIVDVKLVMDSASTCYEDRRLEGVTALATAVAGEGTASHPGMSAAEALEALGGDYSGSSGTLNSTLTLSVPSNRLRPAFELFAEIITEPQLSDVDVDDHRQHMLAELDDYASYPASIADLALSQAIVDPKCRGHRLFSHRQALHAITGEEVRNFRQNHWQPLGSTLILAGDLDCPFTMIDEVLGHWQPETPVPVQPDITAASCPPRLVVVDRPGAVQADLRIGGFGVDRRDSKWVGLKVAATAIGGSFKSRLNSVLREEKGFTYGVGMSIRPFKTLGTFIVSGSFRTEVAAEATRCALNLIDIADQPLTQEEVEDAKNVMLRSAALSYDISSAIAAQAAALATVGLEPVFINQYLRDLSTITPERVNVDYSQVIKPDTATTIIVGDAGQIVPDLQGCGFDPEVITVDDLLI